MKEFKYSSKEIDDLLKRTVVMVDSREKQNKHILDYLEKCGIKYETATLSYGDYSFRIQLSDHESIFFHDSIVVERKCGLSELSNNLAQQRDRFEREFMKACKEHCKVYLMVEDSAGYGYHRA